MPVTHLRALQALESALRRGSLKAAAAELGISPAAVGQRISALEKYLGADLIVRGRSGLAATPALKKALPDLRAAFSALDRASTTLDLQRIAEIHVRIDSDLHDLWLAPRLPRFRAELPAVRFNVNGEGEVPLRLGAPDCRIFSFPPGTAPEGTLPLFTDRWLPIGSPEVVARIAPRGGPNRLEDHPLQHLAPAEHRADPVTWPEWLAAFGYTRPGADRGTLYARVVPALAAVRSRVGFLLCGLALAADDIAAGRALLPFSAGETLPAHAPYGVWFREDALVRPALRRFRDWLIAEGQATQRWLDDVTGTAGPAGPPAQADQAGQAASFSSRTMAP